MKTFLISAPRAASPEGRKGSCSFSACVLGGSFRSNSCGGGVMPAALTGRDETEKARVKRPLTVEFLRAVTVKETTHVRVVSTLGYYMQCDFTTHSTLCYYF